MPHTLLFSLNSCQTQEEIPENIKNQVPMVSTFFDPEEEVIGITFHDTQSIAASQNRLYCYQDGTIGATWIIGFNFPHFVSDRGTGYNYFNGTEWGAWPEERIESDRSGWPCCGYRRS